MARLMAPPGRGPECLFSLALGQAPWCSYTSGVPVSRKRKPKKPKSSRVIRPRTTPAPGDQIRQEHASGLADLFAYRRDLDARRASLAAEAAQALVADLVGFAADRTYPDIEDELCARLGVRLGEWADAPIHDHVGPTLFAEAVITAAAAAVRVTLEGVAADPDGRQAAWQVLTAVARTVAFPLGGMAADAIDDLRCLPGGQVLPVLPDGPAVTSPVLWARDGYGSRFGVIAAFSVPDGVDRWYLWDIDVCGHQAFTVHSAYYSTRHQALAAWQAGVGPLAAEAVPAPVDDPSLLAEILPAEEGFLRAGGESSEQFAEYHRSKRLAEAVLAALGPIRADQRPGDLAASAVEEFLTWLRDQRSGEPQPDGLEEIAEELADSWCISSPGALYHTCSPHRVALTMLHLRNYYQDDFADQMIAMLPDWISWLAARSGTAPELAQRCRPYAHGQPYPGVGSDDSRPNYLARVTE